MVDNCRLEISRRGIEGPFRLVALSLGAMVAVDWCIRFSGEIEACVLINTSMRPFSPFYQRLRPKNYPTFLALVFFGRNSGQWERVVLQLTSNSVRSDLLEEWLKIRAANPVSLRNVLRQLIAAARFRAPVHGLNSPVLLLTSLQDQLVDPQCSIALAKAWKCVAREHSWAGHDLPLDDGAWVVQQIQQWLE
jgi:pimeloyl-ACP methyl ester carboxylesterase